MKPLIIFFMAIAAINGFFLSDHARQEFYQEIERMISNSRKFMMHGDVRVPIEPVKFSEFMRMLEIYQGLSDEERAALKNYLYGVKFPRPTPAHHIESHQPMDQEKLKEMHEKWEAMTPEERDEVRNNRRKDHGEILSRSARSVQGIRPLPEFVGVPNEIPNTRPFPRPEKPIGFPERLRMARPVSLPVAMPEVDRILYPIDGNFQPIKPLQELEIQSASHIERAGPVARPVPMPDVDRVLYPIDGKFQPIKPIRDVESPYGRTRPVDPIARDRLPLPIRKSSSDHSKLFDEMTDEERLQVIRELFPEGLPIRPIGPVPIVPAEKEGGLVFEHEDSDEVEELHTRNIEDYPTRARRPRNFQPILPLQRQPILPIKSQPILPLQSQPILPFKSQPILPQQFQPIMPLQQFQPIMPLQRQPIMPIKSQPILPNQVQPIMPL